MASAEYTPEPPAAGGGVLARNTLWSLLGQVVPMVAAAVAIPMLLHALGNEAFGILTLSWTVIGYFTLFDLGLGRALTRQVAEGLGRGEVEALPALVSTALLLLTAFGAAGGGLLAIATPWLVTEVLRVPAALAADTRLTCFLLAMSLPAVLVTAGLGGVLSAYQRFKALNLIRIPMSLLSFVLPMAVLPFTHRLPVIVGTLVFVRFVGTAAHLGVCLAAMPRLRSTGPQAGRFARPLLQSGGWLGVINVLVPLFASADRLLVSAWTSVGAVAYYATPQELATKLWIVPGTLVSVLFPTFASSAGGDPGRVRALFMRGLLQLFIVLFPVTLVLVVCGHDLLRVWLGAGFEQQGQAPLRWLAIGALCTGLSFIPSALIQAVGRPRRVGLLLLAEVPLFGVLLWWSIQQAGPTGAAVAWMLRALVDLLALLWLSLPWLPDARGVVRQLAGPAIAAAAALAGGFAIVPLALPWRLGGLALCLLPLAVWALGPGLRQERHALRAALTGRK